MLKKHVGPIVQFEAQSTTLKSKFMALELATTRVYAL